MNASLKCVVAQVAVFATAVVFGPLPARAADTDPLDESQSAGLKAVAAASTISLTASTSALVAPATVSLTATIAGTALKGNISFRSGSTTVATAPINNTTATTTVALPVAIHSLTAVFSASTGDIVSSPVVVVVDNALSCG